MPWSEPPRLRYELSLPELMQSIRREYAQHTASRGKLWRALGMLSNYKLSQRPAGVRINIQGVPYAKIRDRGGQIPRRRAKVGTHMKFEGKGKFKGTWYLREAAGYEIPAWGFTEDGFQRWVERTNGRGLRIVWKRRNQRAVASRGR